jgi:hypothetical protein
MLANQIIEFKRNIINIKKKKSFIQWPSYLKLEGTIERERPY